MQIWDTAGQDRFRAITKNYYKGAHGIILMFDVTSTQSFNNIKNWLLQIKENTSEKIQIVSIKKNVLQTIHVIPEALGTLPPLQSRIGFLSIATKLVILLPTC